MEGRDPHQKVAATRTLNGTDVNYGALTSSLLAYLQKQEDFTRSLLSISGRPGAQSRGRVATLCQRRDNGRTAYRECEIRVPRSRPGARLPLLQKSGIPESKGLCRLSGERALATLR